MSQEERKSALQIAYASSMGLAMVLAIFGSLFLGLWLDEKLGTAPFFTLLLLLTGIGAGFRNIYHLIQKYFKDDQPLITSVKSEEHPQRPPPKKA